MISYTEKYTVDNYPISRILNCIESGEIAIPEIQRPFVWKGKQVRDLIDSLYNGYPTGYIIIWQNPDVKLKNGESSYGKKILIDGQQRVTALMTAIVGQEVLDDNYDRKKYIISFNPIAKDDEERFAVHTPIHDKSTFWIPDISVILQSNFVEVGKIIDNYIEKNPTACKDVVIKSIEKLLKITTCKIGVILLDKLLEIREVTEIFVRINSKGARLNEADFVMSKIAADEQFGGNMLRKAIDYFCHLAVDPSFYGQLSNKDHEFMNSEYADKLKWLKDDYDNIYDPDYNDMLRVSFMHKFCRGRLGDLVSLLSGRDFLDRTFKEDIAQSSFEKLKNGVINFMNKYAFEQFVLAIRAAGFVSPKLLNSKMTLDFAYTLYLLLNAGNEVSKVEIKRYVQKWFVLSSLTGRYIGSPESQMDRDLRMIESKGFISFFKEVENAELSDTFWNVGLVQSLETSSISSPYFNVFIAAQVHGNDRSLLSNSTDVSDLLSAGDVHHIFPKEFLKSNGIDDKAMYNQVANYTYLDTAVNISIGKQAPCNYFSTALAQCTSKAIKVGTILDEDLLYENLRVNCIPADIFNMSASDYERFLQSRRVMMAKKIKNYYMSL